MWTWECGSLRLVSLRTLWRCVHCCHADNCQQVPHTGCTTWPHFINDISHVPLESWCAIQHGLPFCGGYVWEVVLHKRSCHTDKLVCILWNQSWCQRTSCEQGEGRVGEKCIALAWTVLHGTTITWFWMATVSCSRRLFSSSKSIAILTKDFIDISAGRMSGWRTVAVYSSAVSTSDTQPSCLTCLKSSIPLTTCISTKSWQNWVTIISAAQAVTNLRERSDLSWPRNSSVCLADAHIPITYCANFNGCKAVNSDNVRLPYWPELDILHRIIISIGYVLLHYFTLYNIMFSIFV